MKLLKKIVRFILSPYKSENKFIIIAGLIIRTIFLPCLVPDFFEVLVGGAISAFQLPELIFELVVWLIMSVVDFLGLNRLLNYLSFNSVGVNYGKGKNPSWGSICYTVYYVLYSILAVAIAQNVILPWILPVEANTIAVIVAMAACVFWAIVSMFISFELGTLPKNWVIKAPLYTLIYLLALFSIGCALIGFPW